MTNSSRRWGLWLALIYIALVGAVAQERKATLSGYVLDRSRQPLPLASVRIEGKGVGTVTNAKGYYKLEHPTTTDSLTLVFSSIGYKTSKRQLPSLQGDLRLTVELGEDELQIDTLQVTARRTPPSSLQQVTNSHIAVSTGPTGGVEGLVGTLSGVAQKNELSSQYTVRGGSFDENLAYINGLEVYRPLLVRSAEQEGLSAINPDMTDRLTFSAGGFGADYGDKISSVLDVRYRRPEALEGSLLVGLMESRLYVGSRHGRLRYATGLRYKRASSLLSTLDTQADYDPHYYDAQAVLSYQLSKHLELGAQLGLNATDYTFMPRERSTSFGTLSDAKQLKISFDGREEDSFRTLTSALSLHWIPNAYQRHSLTLAHYASRERETYDISGEYILSDAPMGQGDMPNALGIGRTRSHGRNAMDYRQMLLMLRSQMRLGDKHRLLVGADARHERIDDKVSEWELRDSVGYTTPLLPHRLEAHRLVRGAHTLSGVRLVAYAEDRMTLGAVSLHAGMRLGWWSWSGELYLSPRLGLHYRPEGQEALSWRASLGLYQQAPTYREVRSEEVLSRGMIRTRLNPDIRSQSAWVASLGADYDFTLGSRRFKLSAEAFGKYVYRLNPYIQEHIRLSYMGRNAGTSYVVGVDAKLYGEFVEGVDSWLSLSLMHGRQRIEGYAPSPLPSAPAVNVSLFFQDYFPRYKPIRLSLRAVYSSGLPVFYPGQGFGGGYFVSSPYRRVDVGLTYRLTDRADGRPQRWWRSRLIKHIDLGLDAFNLFDMLNTSSYYWVTDAYSTHYAVPNYLTRRTYNLSLRLGL